MGFLHADNFANFVIVAKKKKKNVSMFWIIESFSSQNLDINIVGGVRDILGAHKRYANSI